MFVKLTLSETFFVVCTETDTVVAVSACSHQCVQAIKAGPHCSKLGVALSVGLGRLRAWRCSSPTCERIGKLCSLYAAGETGKESKTRWLDN